MILQECRPPETMDDACVWLGRGDRTGIGIVTTDGWKVKACAIDKDLPEFFFPVELIGPTTMHILAVCIMQPQYVTKMMRALDIYKVFLRSSPTLIIGDFNSSPTRHISRHSKLTIRLQQEFGLVNALDEFANRSGVPVNRQTFYHNRKRESPHEIDHCFFPEAWIPRLRLAEIGDYNDWVIAKGSDHCPLFIHIDD